MSNKNVSLDIRNSAASAGDGYTTSGPSRNYCYKYTGGDPDTNNGRATHIVGQGSATVTVTLVADARYKIDTITFTNDDADTQLSVPGSGDHSRMINNRNTKAIEAQYHVTVKDTGNGNASISCDPQIVNRQNS